jgi:hypothetical protein
VAATLALTGFKVIETPPAPTLKSLHKRSDLGSTRLTRGSPTSIVNRTDYWKTGRGIKQLGLSKLDKKGLKKFLLEGRR